MESAISFNNPYGQSILTFIICLVTFMTIDFLFQTDLGIMPALAGGLGAGVGIFVLRKKEDSK